MLRFFKFVSFALCGLLCAGGTAAAQESAAQKTELPVTRITLYSSGVGFFEHSGGVTGQAEIPLAFNASAVNDALKSLVINDTGSKTPSVSYPSEQSLSRALQSLKIDLSGAPGMGELLAAQRGAELTVSAPAAITGRIIGVDRRFTPLAGGNTAEQAYLTLATGEGIRVINLSDAAAFQFTDPALNADLHRALDIIAESRDSQTKSLTVLLPGDAASGERRVSLSYVIPAPVWKASYRLDLGAAKPFIQGWAIVDNDGDTDWNTVRLSLVTGRPVSFIQNLYSPYYQYRPTLPLAIAGTAEAQTYDSGWGDTIRAEAAVAGQAPLARNYAAMKSLAAAPEYAPAEVPAPASPLAAGALETAGGSALGDQFEFTFKNPVTLARQQSALFPLVEGAVLAEKTLVLSGTKALNTPAHPAISVELTNTTGMKLPAGPITVYDAGSYAGDALIGFFPENDRRLISYGDDLSVTGSAAASAERAVSAVKVSKGVMTITRKLVYQRTYTVKNAAAEDKQLIIEHPVTRNAALAEPASFRERTDSAYRFALSLPAGQTITLTVKEESPLAETVTLGAIGFDALLRYTSNQEIPANVKQALQQAADLKLKADEAADALADARSRRALAVSEQDRIRRNLEAAGSQSPQGQEYLRRLVALDGEIDSWALKIEDAEKAARAAKDQYASYLSGLEL
jgi:hypothetical protein